MRPSEFIKIIKENSEKPGILIVGANRCNELKDYGRAGFNPIVMFEPISELCDGIQRRIDDGGQNNAIVHNVAISNYDGKSKFFVASNSVSSSLLQPKQVLVDQNISIEKEIEVSVTTLDWIISDPDNYAALVIDAEGSEMAILEGATNVLKHVSVLCVELNYVENYKGCTHAKEVKKFLADKGFKLIRERHGDHTRTYGDGYFVRS